MPAAAVGPQPPRSIPAVCLVTPRRQAPPAHGRDPRALQAAVPRGDGELSRLRRVARQGRRLRHPGARRHVRGQDRRLLHQRGRPAAVRDHVAARRRGLSGPISAGSTRLEADEHRALARARGQSRSAAPRRSATAAASFAPMASWPSAPRGSPQRCAESSASSPATASPIVAKNCPEYVEMLYGIWHAGLAAVPANAKLHGRRARLHPRTFRRARLLRHARARRARSRRTRRRRLERLIVIGSAGIRRAVRRRSDRGRRRARRRRSRLAVLHLAAPPAGRRARC